LRPCWIDPLLPDPDLFPVSVHFSNFPKFKSIYTIKLSDCSTQSSSSRNFCHRFAWYFRHRLEIFSFSVRNHSLDFIFWLSFRSCDSWFPQFKSKRGISSFQPRSNPGNFPSRLFDPSGPNSNGDSSS
jgi:hypothetical protein